MPTQEQLINDRIKGAVKAQKVTQAQAAYWQRILYGSITDWVIENIETGDGKIKQTSRNYGRIKGLYMLFNSFSEASQSSLLASILSGAFGMLGLNRDYFGSISPKAESVEDEARRLVMLRFGYNTTTKALVDGGYLSGLFDNRDIAKRVGAVMNKAISSGMGLTDFQKQFKAVFVGKDGQGMLERHWKTNTFDLFQRIDRTAGLIYADKLGFNDAIFSGTLEEDSRPFCIKRVNRVYTREEIKAWAKLEFAGKPKIGYDPFTDCGGHNCRHHLSWISKEIADYLRSKQTN